MWRLLMDWLPDLKVGTFEIRDLLSLVMTALGAYLAWLAIKLGKRQSEIAEVQHQMMLALESRRADLRMTLHEELEGGDDARRFVVRLENRGDKSARDFHWRLRLPAWLQPEVRIASASVRKELEWVKVSDDDAEEHVQVVGHCTRPVFPERSLDLGDVVVHGLSSKLVAFFQIETEDGLFPSEMYAIPDVEYVVRTDEF